MVRSPPHTRTDAGKTVWTRAGTWGGRLGAAVGRLARVAARQRPSFAAAKEACGRRSSGAGQGHPGVPRPPLALPRLGPTVRASLARSPPPLAGGNCQMQAVLVDEMHAKRGRPALTCDFAENAAAAASLLAHPVKGCCEVLEGHLGGREGPAAAGAGAGTAAVSMPVTGSRRRRRRRRLACTGLARGPHAGGLWACPSGAQAVQQTSGPSRCRWRRGSTWQLAGTCTPGGRAGVRTPAIPPGRPAGRLPAAPTRPAQPTCTRSRTWCCRLQAVRLLVSNLSRPLPRRLRRHTGGATAGSARGACSRAANHAGEAVEGAGGGRWDGQLRSLHQGGQGGGCVGSNEWPGVRQCGRDSRTPSSCPGSAAAGLQVLCSCPFVVCKQRVLPVQARGRLVARRPSLMTGPAAARSPAPTPSRRPPP